jgi:ubiquinone/menaquinone biosynthesis C-methylase UbiE
MSDDQHCCPHGEEGKKTLKEMNEGHVPQIQWGIDNLPDINPKKVLDVGCGGGIFSRLILEKYPGCEVTGLDLSELSVEHALEFNSEFVKAGRFAAVVGNVEKMPFENDEFDLVVSNASHFFWPDLQENIKEVSKVMKEGAVICLTAGIHFSEEPTKEQRDQFSCRNMVTDETLKGFMEAAGLQTCYKLQPGSTFATYIGVKGDNEGIKVKIRHGWDISAEGYSKRVVPGDFNEPGSIIWTDLILSQAPREGKLKILDVGTGPGVFATLMAKAGHDVVGVDISDKMLEEARQNSSDHGVHPEFIRMDSDHLDFPDGTFDMIINRNVFWIMPDPMAVYREWFRVLKSGGRIVYFDGGHPARPKDYDFKAEMGHMMDNKEEFEKKASFKADEYEAARGWKTELPLTFVERPLWDKEHAGEVGFKDIEVYEFFIEDYFAKYGNDYKGHEANGKFRLTATKP